MPRKAIDIAFEEAPLSESSVSLRLAEIQMRCRELLDDDSSLQLSLEEPVRSTDGFNPYDRG